MLLSLVAHGDLELEQLDERQPSCMETYKVEDKESQ
ncbi:hypothetical protein A2U01_0105369, partial [Trifolium medium]|nr:hypothetical protein [Trifolium medium]